MVAQEAPLDLSFSPAEPTVTTIYSSEYYHQYIDGSIHDPWMNVEVQAEHQNVATESVRAPTPEVYNYYPNDAHSTPTSMPAVSTPPPPSKEKILDRLMDYLDDEGLKERGVMKKKN